MRFCGIDLHSNNSVVVISDEMDKILASRRCPNDLRKILAMLEPHHAELAGVVMESTCNWYWLVDDLKAAVYEVKLANTVAMKRYDGLKHSDDEDDAAHLAHLLRFDILPRGIFTRRPNGRYSISPESASSSGARVPNMCWRL